MSQQKGEQRRLIVTSCQGREFTYKQGKRAGEKGMLYTLAVTQEDGSPVEAQFTAFDDLTPLIGKVTEYTVTFRDSEQYGRTYTLKPPRRDFALELDDLRRRVQRLESQANGSPTSPISATPSASSPIMAGPGLQSQTPAALPAAAPAGGEW